MSEAEKVCLRQMFDDFLERTEKACGALVETGLIEPSFSQELQLRGPEREWSLRLWIRRKP